MCEPVIQNGIVTGTRCVRRPKCTRCGEPLTGMDLWLHRYALGTAPDLRETCRACQTAPTCSKCGIRLPEGWTQAYCPPCRAEYDRQRRIDRKKGRVRT